MSLIQFKNTLNYLSRRQQMNISTRFKVQMSYGVIFAKLFNESETNKMFTTN